MSIFMKVWFSEMIFIADFHKVTLDWLYNISN